MLNIGVIGVGYLGQHHARIYSGLEGVRLIGVVDTDINRAEEIAKKYGCNAYSDYREILDKVDALSIVTPTISHYHIAMDCITAGKHVLIEKPITNSVEDADRLIEESQKRDIIIQVGHLERFNPVFPVILRLVKKPIFIETERLSPFLGRGIDVDITLDLLIHDIDIILALLKNDKSVSIKDIKAIGSKVMTENIDIAKAWIDFDNGSQALLTASRISFEKSRKLKIFQEDAYFLVDYQNMEIKRFFMDGEKINHESINVNKEEPLKEEIKDFIDCIINRRRPIVSALEGRDALKIALEINKIIKTRKEVFNEAND